MDKMILTDKTEITIKEGASLNAITAVVEQFKDLDPIASAILKEGNLDAVQFKSEENWKLHRHEIRISIISG